MIETRDIRFIEFARRVDLQIKLKYFLCQFKRNI